MHSPNRPYVPQIDELRGLAALLVFYFHAAILGHFALGHTGWIRAATPLDALLYEGHTGVGLFMVLSGFVLSKGVIGRPLSYGRFLRNRLLRIAPLTILVCVFAISSGRDVTLGQALAPFLLLQNVLPLALSDKTGLSATVWTVATEFQFYLVAPFLFAFVARDGIRRFLLPLMLLLIALRVIALAPALSDRATTWSVPYFTMVGRANQFLLGIGLGALWPRLEALPEEVRRRWGMGMLGIGAAGALALSFLLNRGGGQYAWHAWRFVHQDIEGLVWVLFIAGYVLVDPMRRLPRLRRAATGLGLISFSLYILHWSVLSLSLVALPRLGIALPEHRGLLLLLATLVILPPVIALASLSYWCVERPFLAARSRYIEPAGPASASAHVHLAEGPSA